MAASGVGRGEECCSIRVTIIVFIQKFSKQLDKDRGRCNRSVDEGREGSLVDLRIGRKRARL